MLRGIGDRTGLTTHGPDGTPTQTHWCQPLPFAVPGAHITVCGYCSAPLVRLDDAADWRYGREQRVQLSLFEQQLTLL